MQSNSTTSRPDPDDRFKRYREKNKDLLAAKARAAYHSKSPAERKTIRESRKEYHAQWCEENAERLKKRRKQYQAEHAEDIKLKKRAYYLANREKFIARAAENAKANKERVRETQKRWVARNPEKRKQWSREWSKKNPDKKRAACKRHREKYPEYHKKRCAEWTKLHPIESRGYVAKRRARMAAAGIEPVTQEDIIGIWQSQRGHCSGCKAKLDKYHIDHVMPIALGGRHAKDNIQLLCPKCNLSKHDMHPDDWARRLGKLFI